MADKSLMKKSGSEREYMHYRGELLSSSLSHLPGLSGSTSFINIKSGDQTGEEHSAVKGRVTFTLALTALISVFGTSVPHGWNTGVLNAPEKVVREFLNSSFSERFGRNPHTHELTLLSAFAVSIYLVGGCIGAFSAGTLANRLGRKRGILFCHVFGFVAAILFGFCKMARSFEMLFVGRFIVGVGCGAGTGLVPMYLTEVSPVNVRGAMGVLHQLGLTVGIFLSMIFGLKQVLGNEGGWPILLSLTAVPCLVSLIVLPWMPESPRYLYVNKKNKDAAEKALQTYRKLEDVSADIAEMEYEVKQQEKDPKWSIFELLRNKSLRMPLVMVCSLAMCQQLSGINFVFYYSTSVFLNAGVPEEYVQYATMATGFINVGITIVSVPLVEKTGRRVLLIGGMSLMLVSMTALTISLWFQYAAKWLAYICIVCTISYVLGFAIGLGSIPQFLPAELFKQGPRPPAMSLAGLLNWACNFLVGMLFPTMLQSMGPLSFIVFMAVVLGFGILVYFKLPETKNKSFEEIYQIVVGKQTGNEEEPEPNLILLKHHDNNHSSKN